MQYFWQISVAFQVWDKIKTIVSLFKLENTEHGRVILS